MLTPDWPRHLLTADPTTESRVAHLCDACVEGLTVSGASLRLLAGAPHPVPVHATDRVARQIDQLQQEFGEGPGIDVEHRGGPVLADDLEHGGRARWPWFAPGCRSLGVGAAFAWPVQVCATLLGVLSLYRRRPGPLTSRDLADAVEIADAAAIVLLDGSGLDTSDALVWAIADRSRFQPEVHQATGMLTVQLHLGIVDSFARLCAAAYADRRPMVEMSRDIVSRRIRLDSA